MDPVDASLSLAGAGKNPMGFTWGDNGKRDLRASLGHNEAELPPGAGDRSCPEPRHPGQGIPISRGRGWGLVTRSVFRYISASLWAFAPFSPSVDWLLLPLGTCLHLWDIAVALA